MVALSTAVPSRRLNFGAITLFLVEINRGSGENVGGAHYTVTTGLSRRVTDVTSASRDRLATTPSLPEASQGDREGKSSAPSEPPRPETNAAPAIVPPPDTRSAQTGGRPSKRVRYLSEEGRALTEALYRRADETGNAQTRFRSGWGRGQRA